MSKPEGIPTSNFEQVCPEGVFIYSNTGNVVSHVCKYKQSSHPDASPLYTTACMKFGDEGICYVVKIEEEAKPMKLRDQLVFENGVVINRGDIVKIESSNYRDALVARVIGWNMEGMRLEIDAGTLYHSDKKSVTIDYIMNIIVVKAAANLEFR